MSVHEVTQTLEQLIALHEQLLELGETKRQVLIRNDVDELTRITNRESKLGKEIDGVNQLRLEATARFLQGKGYRMNPSVTVSDLTKLVFNAEEKNALVSVQRSLTDCLNRLREQNDLNQKLIEQSLSFINYSIDLVSGPEDEAIYRNPGLQQGQSGKRSGYFDTRA